MLWTGVLLVTQPAAEDAWRELEHRLRGFVARRVPSPSDADDVLQDVFVRMQRALGEVRETDRFASWVFSIARNVIADHRRDRARHPLASAEPRDEAHELDDDREELTRELTGCVARFVAALPSPYREAITLTELEGMSQKDAAAMLGISHSGMKSRVQRGRALLLRMFEDSCAIELDVRSRVLECAPRACDGCGSVDERS